MFKATSTCGSLKVRLRRLTEAEINTAQNEVQDTKSEASTVEFIIHTGETTSDSDSDGETFGMVRAPTPIVISSDEEEEIRRGEIDITEENSQRLGDGYTEYTRRATMTMKIFDDRVTNKQPPQQRQAIENTRRYEEDHNAEEETALILLAEEDRGLEQWLKEIADIEVQAAEPKVVDEIEKWLRQTGEPTTTPPGWRNFTNIDLLPTELITKIRERKSGKRNNKLQEEQNTVWHTRKSLRSEPIKDTAQK
ncbi:unnamed protein product [Ceratitis capitata]|uniref:(Mediterranean fruit fly) hypothetical protein n=1 Tax=Ceratitis capitata TaxID=7213 RepID=A0A811USR4_CERCA|nr:unnamed protein product [Ceratitis capitata]